MRTEVNQSGGSLSGPLARPASLPTWRVRADGLRVVRVSLIAGVLAAGTTACSGSIPTMPSADALPAAAAPISPVDVLSSDVARLQGGQSKVRKVKSGTLTTTSTSMSGSLTLSGPRFQVTGFWSDGGSTGCQPCQSGVAAIWTSAAFTGSPGSATIDGVHYDQVYLSGGIRVSGNALVPSSDSSTFTVPFPFSTDGSSVLVGYASNPWVGPAQELFRLEVRGSGTAALELDTVMLPDRTKVYTARGLSYTF